MWLVRVPGLFLSTKQFHMTFLAPSETYSKCGALGRLLGVKGHLSSLSYVTLGKSQDPSQSQQNKDEPNQMLLTGCPLDKSSLLLFSLYDDF